MSETNSKSEKWLCPVARVLGDLEQVFNKKSEFMGHLMQSRIEFLKAIRSLIDVKIERLEKTAPSSGKKKMTKIKVE